MDATDRPGTGTNTPVTPDAASDSKNAIVSATSDVRVHFAGSASGISALFCGVSIVPGNTAFTRIFSGASSIACSVSSSAPRTVSGRVLMEKGAGEATLSPRALALSAKDLPAAASACRPCCGKGHW